MSSVSLFLRQSSTVLVGTIAGYIYYQAKTWAKYDAGIQFLILFALAVGITDVKHDL